MTASSDRRRPSAAQAASRFVRSEDITQCAQWTFRDVVVKEAPPSSIDADALEERLQEARKEAYALGWEEAQLAAQQRWQEWAEVYERDQQQMVAERLSSLLQDARNGLIEIQEHMAEQVLDLVCALARQVLRAELTLNAAPSLYAAVREALQMLVDDASTAFVRLSPSDYQFLHASLVKLVGERALQFVADPDLAPGSCKVEAAGATVDAGIERRWQQAVAGLGRTLAWQDPAASNA